jgi:subtilisin-like proprotein convertase family protein/subtilisin family serine protease
MSSRRRSLLRRLNRQRLAKLGHESLEPRQLLAVTPVSLLTETAAPDLGAAATLERSQPAIEQQLGEKQAATHHYLVDGVPVGMVISDTRIALSSTPAGRANTSWHADFGLNPLRPLAGTSFNVYATAGSLAADQLQQLFTRGVVDRTAPVFDVLDTRSEAVLLDEAIVELAGGVDPVAYFAGQPLITGHRPLSGTPNQFVVTLSAEIGEPALDVINRLTGDRELAWAAPNFHQNWQRHFTPNDPRWSNLWHLENTGQSGGLPGADADLPAAWDVIQGGSTNLTIAVVDDGVSTDHPDITAWTNPGEIPGNGIDDDGNGWVDDVHGWNFVDGNNVSFPNNPQDAHGTAVAGVAAARGDNGIGVAGASYGTPVLSSRIFAGSGVATDANVAAAIYYAAGRTADGLGTWRAADITNHSWGGGATSAAVNAALSWATTAGREGRGSAQFFSAGNDGYFPIGYPATQAAVNSGIVVVGSMNNLGERSAYSQVGELLDILTPSDDSRAGYLAIDTTDRVGSDGYNATFGTAGDYTGTGTTGFGGTSSAAPLATGIGALALAHAESLGFTLTPAELRSVLRTNTRLIDAANASYDPVTAHSVSYGFGLLSAGSLVRGIGTKEISVITAGREIESGDASSFGSVVVDDTLDTTLRIRNQGTLPLSIQDITIEGDDFTVVSGSGQSTLGLGEAMTFTLRFAPSAAGLRSATVTILSDDADEAVFTIDVEGTGVATSVSGYLFEDASGDGVRQMDEPVVAGRQVFLDANGNGVFDDSIEDVTVEAQIDIGLIPDGTGSGPGAPLVSSLQVVGLTQGITDVDVAVEIEHTWVSDLDLFLISPSGRRIALAFDVGGSGDDFSGTIFDDAASTSIAAGTPPFTGRFRPLEPLSSLNGEDANGTWQLEITDFFAEDQGTLVGWSVRIRTGEAATLSKPNGYYAFSGLEDGSYAVGAVLPAGWSPSGDALRSFTVGPESSARGTDFGSGVDNRFYGRIFDDANGDGLQEPGEPGLPGRVLFVDTNGNGVLDPPTESTFTSTTPLELADDATTTSQLALSGLGTPITDVNVRLNITHTWDSDLDVFLIAPDGTRVELFTDVGGSGENFTDTVLDDQAAASITSGDAPFTGTFRPEGLLSDFNGTNPNGTWTLEITDDFAGDFGTLNSWAIVISALADATQLTDAGGWALFDLAGGQEVTVVDAGDASWVSTGPASGSRTVTASGLPIFGQTFGTKQRPEVAADIGSVTVPEGTAATVDGTWGTRYPADVITLTATIGSVTKHDDGSWSWTATPEDQLAETTVTITASDPLGIASEASFTYEATNAPPALGVDESAVVGDVLQALTNTGSWSDVAADTVSLSASLGEVTQNPDGSWSWSLMPSVRLVDETVTITATDEDGGAADVSFTVSARVAVANQQIYYKGSSFANTSVPAALDPGKSLARPGDAPQTLSYANLINSTRGLNGLVLDVAGLASTDLTADDFSFRMSPQGSFNEAANPPSSWVAAPAPTAIVVTAGDGSTPARIRLEWEDNAIADRWLQVAVLATQRTGLDSAVISYVGHLQGEVNGQISSGRFRVTVADILPFAGQVGSTVDVGAAIDLVKDGRIRLTDVTAVGGRIGTAELRVITIPAAGSDEHGTFGETGSGSGQAGVLFGGGSGSGKATSKGRDRSISETDFGLLAVALASGDTTTSVGGSRPSAKNRMVDEWAWGVSHNGRQARPPRGSAQKAT